MGTESEIKEKIILVGFMASGKSAVGKSLALRLNKHFLDTDEWIENRENLSIPEIFAKKGEAHFRTLEHLCFQELQTLPSDFVISTGGGFVSYQNSIENVLKLGHVIYLKENFELLYSRLRSKTENRPLAQQDKDKLKELFQIREKDYEQANLVLDTNKLTIGQICTKITQAIKSY